MIPSWHALNPWRNISPKFPMVSRSCLGSRCFSILKRPSPNYTGHVPLTVAERTCLALGSALISLSRPRRADLIAALGEATATPYFIHRLRDAMLSDATGRRILRERPRIKSTTIDMNYLRTLPHSTVGRSYVAWLDRERVTPDTRDNVRYIDDEECAYVMQRYRECHDFYHALVGLPVMVEGEVALKAFEFANTLLPVAGLSMAAVAILKPAERARFLTLYLPWALSNGFHAKHIINIYWEELFERNVNDLRFDLCIEKPVDLRDIRRQEKLRKDTVKESKASSHRSE